MIMTENRMFERRWFMCDFARLRLFCREEFSLWLDALVRLGYNGLGIYLEGAFAFETIPGVLREGVMTSKDAMWVMEECGKRGIFVFPLTNVIGHMEHFFKQERFSDLLMEGTGLRQLNFQDERAEQLAMRIVHEFTKHFPCGMIHIGGDETKLTEENKIPYAKFIAKICRNLLDEGIQPAIWDDMFWMDQPLCAYLDRRVMIFDWNYYGHRPESLEFFKNEGFGDIIACPCDNSWEGFITYQHTSGWLRAHTDIPVQPDEVEAFFDDARKQGVMNGMLTNWNNEHGRNMWAQWTAIARAGLYMSGALGIREQNDNAIEMALFGRITPYTKITRLLQQRIPYTHDCDIMRNALYFRDYLYHIFDMAKRCDFVPPCDYRSVAAEAEALLDAWAPENAFERNCVMAMYGVAGMLRASAAVLDAMNMYSQYKTAARLQFDAPENAAQIISRVAGQFRAAVCELESFAVTFRSVIDGTGHNPVDIDFILETADILASVADLLDDSRKSVARIPLLRFDTILECAVSGKVLYL